MLISFHFMIFIEHLLHTKGCPGARAQNWEKVDSVSKLMKVTKVPSSLNSELKLLVLAPWASWLGCLKEKSWV
jgi:hypothetical protein